VALVRGALSPRRARAAGPLLDLLARRLAALAEVARGRPCPLPGGAAERARWRRFLRPLEGTWHDGDENLVRGFLDRWGLPGQDPGVSAARGLVDAAEALARIEPRPETLWFYLWEMESLLSGRATGPRTPREQWGARTPREQWGPGPRARIPSVRNRTPWRS
jgi:hypothetical protein